MDAGLEVRLKVLKAAQGEPRECIHLLQAGLHEVHVYIVGLTEQSGADPQGSGSPIFGKISLVTF